MLNAIQYAKNVDSEKTGRLVSYWFRIQVSRSLKGTAKMSFREYLRNVRHVYFVN